MRANSLKLGSTVSAGSIGRPNDAEYRPGGHGRAKLETVCTHAIVTLTPSGDPRNRTSLPQQSWASAVGLASSVAMTWALEENAHAADRTVEFLNAQKVFGFITPDEGGKDVFVDVTAVSGQAFTAWTKECASRFETETTSGARVPRPSTFNRHDAPQRLFLTHSISDPPRKYSTNLTNEISPVSIPSRIGHACRGSVSSFNFCELVNGQGRYRDTVLHQFQSQNEDEYDHSNSLAFAASAVATMGSAWPRTASPQASPA